MKRKSRPYSQADLDAVSDSPELTAEDIAQAQTFAAAFPALAAKMVRKPEGETAA